MIAIAPESSNGLARLVDCVEQTSTVSLKFDPRRPQEWAPKNEHRFSEYLIGVSKGKEKRAADLARNCYTTEYAIDSE